MLFAILAECELRSEKLLVFSQSLLSLDVIEEFLKLIDENTQKPNTNTELGGFNGDWTKGISYFRLDGTTDIDTRSKHCEIFNNPENARARFVKTKQKNEKF